MTCDWKLRRWHNSYTPMIPYKPRTFATEADRKADYLSRVGPLIIPRTNTTERPDPDMTLGQWLDWLRLRER